MKRNYLMILMSFWLVVSVAGLTGGQVNTILSMKIDKTPTPTPTFEIVASKGCVISKENTPKTKPTPATTPFSPEETKYGVEYPLPDSFETWKYLDRDCDGISDFDDNCIEVFNPKQEDRDKNNIGDACQPKKNRKAKRNSQQ